LRLPCCPATALGTRQRSHQETARLFDSAQAAQEWYRRVSKKSFRYQCLVTVCGWELLDRGIRAPSDARGYPINSHTMNPNATRTRRTTRPTPMTSRPPSYIRCLSRERDNRPAPAGVALSHSMLLTGYDSALNILDSTSPHTAADTAATRSHRTAEPMLTMSALPSATVHRSSSSRIASATRR
jgi:hypothetical protein